MIDMFAGILLVKRFPNQTIFYCGLYLMVKSGFQ